MTVLLLAGTGEARDIADRLAVEGRECILWRDPAVRLPGEWPLPLCAGTLADCIARPEVSAVLDATHPFASAPSHAAAQLCAAKGLPYCLLLRPEWRALPTDCWINVASEADARQHIAPGSTIFLATGRDGLEHFAGLEECYIYCRQIGDAGAPFPFPNGEFLVQQPPFPVEKEVALFRRLGIDWLVLRNSGSRRAYTKLTAARQIGLRVLMISRPAPPEVPIVTTVKEALAWVQQHEHQDHPHGQGCC